jgi:S1-C subfamily serine protease
MLHWFTGAHPEYHTPRDVAAQVDMDGVVRIAGVVADVTTALARHPSALTYVPDTRAGFVADRRAPRVSLGVMPDYGSRPPGLRIQGVRAGSAAALAGLRAGDVLLSLGPHAVESAGDLMFALGEFEPEAAAEIRFRRDGQDLTTTAKLRAGRYK